MATSPSPSTSPILRTPHATPNGVTGPAIYARRQTLGVYRHTLASAAHVAVHTLGRIERGERTCDDLQELQRLDYALSMLEAAYRDACEHSAEADELLAS